VKLVLIACNTASANALPALRAASPVPVIGAVDPGAESALAATRNGHIGVIGTLGTVRSGAYERALGVRTGVRVTQLACPLFVPLAEEGWTEAGDDVARGVARRYLNELFENDRDIDTIVLGCTHYPLLRGVITETARELTGRDVAIVDSATAMAEAAASALRLAPLAQGERAAPLAQGERGASALRLAPLAQGERGAAALRLAPLAQGERGSLACFATDISRLDEIAPRFLGEPITSFELVDL
jgi:glutamate racemase